MKHYALFCALFALGGLAFGGSGTILDDRPIAEGPRARLGRFDVRGRVSHLSVEFLSAVSGAQELPARGDRWTFHPFDDVALELVIDEVSRGSRGGVVAYGTLAGEVGGSFALARTDDAVHLNVYDGRGRAFGLRHLEGTLHSVVESVLSEQQGCPQDGAAAKLPEDAEPQALGLDTNHDIDVLVVYSPAALDLAGGSHAAMVSSIEAALAQGNQALANSLADGAYDAHYDLVGTVYADWQHDAKSFSHQLGFFKAGGTGYLDDDVVRWRLLSGADLVALIIGDENDSQCGIAYIMDLDEGHGIYSVTRWDCMSTGFTLAHELGHNLGCAHNPEDVDSNGTHSFSFGHRWTGTDLQLYRSVMSYDYSSAPFAAQVPYYSNPGIDFAGVPTGLTSRDNARTIELNGGYAESYLSVSSKLSNLWVDLDKSPFAADGTGSVNFPYGTMQEALLKVANGGTIHVKGPGQGRLPYMDRIATVQVETGPLTFIEGP